MDTIGLMVTQIEDGFLRITSIGDVDPRILPGQAVIVHTARENLPGVIVMPTPKMLPPGNGTDVVDIPHLFVDVSLPPSKMASLVRIGELVSFGTEAVEMSGDTVSGHSIDNRASIAALTLCLQELQSKSHIWDVWATATVQEEIDFGGAATSAHQLRPDLAIAVDGTFAKAPETNHWDTFELGKGPVFGFGTNILPYLCKRFKYLAEQLEIPYATEIIPKSSDTDAMAMQIAAEGIPTFVLSIPVRNLQTPVDMVALKDIQHVGQRLAEFIVGLDTRLYEYHHLGQVTMPVSQPIVRNTQFKLLEKLCNACAVSGNESEVRKIVLKKNRTLRRRGQSRYIGECAVTIKGSNSNRPRVMLDTHMDEVGFILVSDKGDGLYRFETVGSIDPFHLPGKPVWVGKDHLPGVIGTKPIHLVSDDELKLKIPLDTLRIDLGPSGKANAGDWAAFATKFKRVGPSIMAKAIDDRIGVATLIELVKHAPPNIDLLAAFTVQEEVGLRGAKAAANAFNPDLTIAIDSTPAYDMPKHNGTENTAYNTRIGLGPAIYVCNGATIDDPRLIRFSKRIAEAEGIPYQIRQPGNGETDAGAIQRTREGIPVVSVSVPHRYPHAPISIERVDDWKNTLKLLHSALARVTPKLPSGN